MLEVLLLGPSMKVAMPGERVRPDSETQRRERWIRLGWPLTAGGMVLYYLAVPLLGMPLVARPLGLASLVVSLPAVVGALLLIAAYDLIGVSVAYYVVSLILWVVHFVAVGHGDFTTSLPLAAASLGVLSITAGVLVNRWAACLVASAFWLAALTADLLWIAGVIHRAEYDQLPAGFGVFWFPFLLPALAALVALGVGLRRGVQRVSSPSRP